MARVTSFRDIWLFSLRLLWEVKGFGMENLGFEKEGDFLGRRGDLRFCGRS